MDFFFSPSYFCVNRSIKLSGLASLSGLWVYLLFFFHANVELLEQAKPETVEKVCKIVKKQLALPEDSSVTGESKFAALGADSLDTVIINIMGALNVLLFNAHFIFII